MPLREAVAGHYNRQFGQQIDAGSGLRDERGDRSARLGDPRDASAGRRSDHLYARL